VIRKLRVYLLCSAAVTVFGYVGWTLATPVPLKAAACTCGPAHECPPEYKCGGACSPITSQYYGAECIPD
jgi:hypothetical protein